MHYLSEQKRLLYFLLYNFLRSLKEIFSEVFKCVFGLFFCKVVNPGACCKRNNRNCSLIIHMFRDISFNFIVISRDSVKVAEKLFSLLDKVCVFSIGTYDQWNLQDIPFFQHFNGDIIETKKIFETISNCCKIFKNFRQMIAKQQILNDIYRSFIVCLCQCKK